MPYLFGGLVLLNAIMLGYHSFFAPTSATQDLEMAQAQLTQPISFTNSAKYIPPPIGSKD